MNIKSIVIPMLALFLFGFAACNDDDNQTEAARIRVMLTDGPGDYDAVHIDIKDVQINRGDSDDNWVSLNEVEPGIYDLLLLTGGLDTLLGETDFPAGRLGQIRLILGDNNTIEVNGSTEELKTPSAQQSGLKIKLDTDLEEGLIYTILLDFDVARSIVEAGNSGQYILKPVIRATVEATAGAIQGLVMPSNVQTVIYTINGADTLSSTYTNDAGKFLVQAVPAGTYKLSIVPADSSGLGAKVMENVAVTKGVIKDVGTINLEN